MYYLLYKLCEHGQEANLARLRSEADKIRFNADLHRKDVGSGLPPFLDACLLESMRLKPVGPVVIRRAVRDDVAVLSDKRVVRFRAGDGVVVNLAQLHRDPVAFNKAGKCCC